jgi:hypothetical protein
VRSGFRLAVSGLVNAISSLTKCPKVFDRALRNFERAQSETAEHEIVAGRGPQDAAASVEMNQPRPS